MKRVDFLNELLYTFKYGQYEFTECTKLVTKQKTMVLWYTTGSGLFQHVPTNFSL
jgi:hypothetical protein